MTLTTKLRREVLTNARKVFYCDPIYADVRRCLLERGWLEDSNPHSTIFDLSFTLYHPNVPYDMLRKGQVGRSLSGTGPTGTAFVGASIGSARYRAM